MIAIVAGLDAASGHDQLEGGGIALLVGGGGPIHSPSRVGHPHRTDRAPERDPRDDQRRRGGVDRDDVVRVLLVGAQIVEITWTSLAEVGGKAGRSGRSVSRQVRTACSPGRPSRRKNDPGIFPAAYIRSSTSTVSGKKSMPSRGLG